ncbi:MAG: hypothetical protein B7Y80_14120 [Hyphomicrobium sp. 32-62-53]|nr:MAG: hypothetical protein B7Z29_07675 [Hyphomicrobium sp. 12-62-95]OYX98841.1 MAG: hypothetical protein B7Y80_14120 [Hyphomicrobium sp. 32-62-53]
MNAEWFTSIDQARVVIAQWLLQYRNDTRETQNQWLRLRGLDSRFHEHQTSRHLICRHSGHCCLLCRSVRMVWLVG